MKLTEPQKSIYNMEKFTGGAISNICGSILVGADKSVEKIKKAVDELYRLNNALRIRISEKNGQPYQYITEYEEQEFEVLYFCCKEEFDNYASEYAKEAFCFGGPLSDIKIIILPDKKGIMAKLHHIISDAWTLTLIGTQFNKILNEEDVHAYSYADYINTEEKYIESKRYIKDKEYFVSQFQKCDEVTYFSEKQDCTFESKRLTFISEKENFAKILTYAKENDVSVFSLFLSAIAIYMNRTKRNVEKFFIGTSVLNRSGVKEQNTMGMFINTAPILIELDNDGSFTDNLTAVETSAISALRHQKYNYSSLLEELRKNHNFNKNLYDVILNYQNAKVLGHEFESTWYHNGMQVESLQINIDDRDSEGCFKIHYDYRIDKFSNNEIIDLHNHLCNLLFDALENPDKKICDLEMLSDDEKQKILCVFNDTASDYEKDKCIHELFEEQVERTPDKVAVVASDKTLTYKELNEEANRIAHSLVERGVGKGDIVGLLLPRKSCFLSALFGVLKTGAAYLPIDCDFPEERIKHILSDSNAKLCISEDNFSVLLENQNAENLTCTASSDDFCYCIYTSGSTGKAKGTLIYHRNLIWYMSVLKNIYGTDNINMPFFTSQSVDLTVPSFYLPLLTGGTTYLYNGELKDDLVDIFNNEALTVLKFTPTHIRLICNLIHDKQRSNIRYVIVGGETLYTESCVEFLNKFGHHIEIHNEYGPTEATVSCTDYVFNPKENASDSYLTIGKPVNNSQLYITDEYLNPVPIGVTGEICIAGDGVGAGYLNNPGLTAEKFIDNPFGEGKLYKTGDLAYWREDGNIIYVGRSDFQVKIRGLRIELEEIENAIQSVNGVVQCAVTVRKDESDGQFICAFYTGEEKSIKEIKEEIGKSLPKYMVPHIFTYLPEMPLTSSGKVNRTALPEVDIENIVTETEYAEPKTQEEQVLADAVCSVLGSDSINMLENFLNIGGDSIKAIYVVSELVDMGYELHVADIMQNDTLADVAKALKPTSDRAIYDQNEVNGFIPFSPIMRAFLEEKNTIPGDFVHNCIMSADCDEKTARKVFDALISHHDILRGVFSDNGIEIHPSEYREVYSFETIAVNDLNEAKEYLKKNSRDDDKLVNVLFCVTENENLISITVHHFLIDLVSWEIFANDFYTAVNQLNNSDHISLPAKTASFMLWSEELQKYSETISEESKAYWKNINKKLDNAKSFHSHQENENEAEKYSFTLDKNISNKLINEANNAYGTRINEVLLTALGLAACKIADGRVGIIVESHGRTELNKSIAVGHTIGWFTSCYPVVIENNNNLEDTLINIKETLRKIPKNGIDYLLLSRGFHKNADIKFNFYNHSITNGGEENKTIAFNSAVSGFPGKINVDCFITQNVLTVNISAPECKYKKGLSEKIGVEFIKQIENIVDFCTITDTVTKTLSDFSDDELSEIELEELKDLFDWTDDDEEQ